MKNLEKYLSRRALFGMCLSTLVLLPACGVIKAKEDLATELAKMTYKIATLPLKPFFWLKSEPSVPSINRCIETPEEKVCKLYLKQEIDFGVYEEYFGVLEIKKVFLENQPSDLVKLILGYFDGDNYDFDGKKNLVVLMYTGRDSKEFVVPTFGNPYFPYDLFEAYFNDPIKEILDTRENPLKIAEEKNLISLKQFEEFLKLIREQIGEALKIADEQFPRQKKNLINH